MRIAIALAVVGSACSGKGPLAPQIKPVVRLVGCAPAAALPRVALDDPSLVDPTSRWLFGDVVRVPRSSVLGPGPWTPYSVDTTLPGPAAAIAARGAEAVVRGRLGAIDACFSGPAPTGSLRAMLELGVDGVLGAVRVGGLGDARGEACTARAFDGLRVVTPVEGRAEIACDLARGDAQPWRVTPTAGYEVIDVERSQLRHGADTLVPGTSDPEALPETAYVVLLRRETPGAMLQLALLWANDATSVVVAVEQAAGAPVFLGIGHTAITQSDDDSEEVHPALRIDAKSITGCVGRATHPAKLSDPAAVDAALHQLAAKCRSMQCSSTLAVAIDSDAVVRDLVEVVGAARRAGFDRVVLGGSELGCSAKAAPKKPRNRDDEVEDE